MGDSIIELMLPLVGVVVGFLLSYLVNYWNKRCEIKRYSAILRFELKGLKENIPDGLDGVIQRYQQLVEQRDRQIREKGFSAGMSTSDYLKRWSFRNKYPFLRNNFEKISLFKGETITSILKIYSYLEEFEEYKQLSISDPEALLRIGMGDAELLLIGNLQKAQEEISSALSFLASE